VEPKLVGIAGPFKGMRFSVAAAETTIGRDPENHCWTSDPSLSRRHCLLRRQVDRVTIQDLGSRNGSIVNGIPVTEQELQHQDQICVGDSLLVFLKEEEDAIDAEKSSSVVLTETVELGPASVQVGQEAFSPETRSGQLSISERDRTSRNLDALLTIATRMGGIRNRESLEWQLLGMIFDVVPADRAAILHCDKDCDVFDSAIAWDRIHGPGEPVEVSSTVVRRVFRERVAILISDRARQRNPPHVELLEQLGVHSLLCVPLLHSDSVLGMIYLDSSSATDRIDQGHLEMMRAIAGLASLAIQNLQRWDELQEENRLLRGEINLEHNIVGRSPRMQAVYELIRKVAPLNSTVLIQGETGTGKELVARAIHRNSPRSARLFVAVNCAALTESLLESELFGHEKGAFTGAIAQKKGKLEVAEGGTLFLDEVSEMTPALQAKLLRFLQEREFERVGGTRTVKTDVRVISAANKSLAKMVDEEAFRKDLYYRLNVVAITMPPLRERREDILLLAHNFIGKVSKKCGLPSKRLSPDAQSILASYDWPGNVRELENVIERAMALGTADTLLADDLPENMVENAIHTSNTASATYYSAIKSAKTQVVLQAFQQAGGNYIEAAKALGLHPNSLLRLVRSLGLRSLIKAEAPND
jgi:transcriptional regulator with GAF, ATPase, and Fis domain